MRVYLGHHKCASTYVTDCLLAVCQHQGLTCFVEHRPRELPFEMHKGRGATLDWLSTLARFRTALTKFDFLIHRNADPAILGELGNREWRGIHVIRDPRDILVSGYFSHLYSHRETPLISRQRSILSQLSKEDGLLAELDFCQVYFDRLADWDYGLGHLLELKFETLIERPFDVFGQALDFLGLSLPGEVLQKILDSNSFETRTGRQKGQEDVHNKFRKGKAGDWQHHFTPKVAREFGHRFGHLLQLLGYS